MATTTTAASSSSRASLAPSSSSAVRPVISFRGARRPQTVRAQAQSLRAPDTPQQQQQQQPPRGSMQAASSSSTAHHQLQQLPGDESSWITQLARFFNVAPDTQEQEEWRSIYGRYLDDDEELGRHHSMFVSHLAERLAVEPRSSGRS